MTKFKVRKFMAKINVRRLLAKDAKADNEHGLSVSNECARTSNLFTAQSFQQFFTGQRFDPPGALNTLALTNPNGFARFDSRRGAGRYGRGSRGLASGPGCIGVTARPIVRDLHSATPTQPGL
ncbi:hypothetical protein FPRO05_01133 [Fusarium proliferatum]|uniref:Uncharacterized protein n=1 Tax=Gibberella intermedia TaxID=948311 RepID=A0A365NPX3_GIBIN|nr:hypothetical protein FPRO05_01133 [Fusarium proliferatum]